MRSLVQFFLFTYAVTWTCFIAAAALSASPWSVGALAGGLSGMLLLLGAFGPSLVALGLTARADGSAGALALLRRVFEWRVGAQWYVFAVSYMATIKLAVALAHRFVTGVWPVFGNAPWYVIAVSIVIATPSKAGEEIGWRGYALPRLAARFGLARATLMLGLIGACWHLPLFFIPGIDKFGQSFPLFALYVTALYVAASWLYGHTNGSLLLVMLLHSAVNESVGIVQSALPGATNPFALSTSLTGWLTLAFVWIPAAYFLVRMRHIELSAPSETAYSVSV